MARGFNGVDDLTMQIALSPHPAVRAPIARVVLSILALAFGFAVAAAVAGFGPFDGVRGGERDAAARAVRAVRRVARS